MKSDEEIASEVAAMAPIIGPTHAGWYKEACEVGYGEPHEVILWACRCRELARVAARDMGSLARAAQLLVDACGRLDEGGGSRVRDAAEEVVKALWWYEEKDGA